MGYILRKFTGDIKLGRMVDMLKARISVQRDFDRLEKQANRNLREFIKQKCKSHSFGRIILCTSRAWWPTVWKAALQKMTWGS